MSEKVQVTLTPGDWSEDAPLNLKIADGVSTFAAILALMNSLGAIHKTLIDSRSDPKILAWLADGVSKLADAIASGDTSFIEAVARNVKLN
jgi:hypothetical protein